MIVEFHESKMIEIEQPKNFGHGWISGTLSVTLGAIGVGAVLCFHFPWILTMPELREVYPIPYIRALLHLILVSSFVLGVLSIILRRRKVAGFTGIGLTLLAALMGGSQVAIDGEMRDGPFLGLDWFLLNLIVFSVLFVPLEQLFPKRTDQPILRPSWRIDLTYFFFSAVLVQLTTILTLKPAMILFSWAVNAHIQSWVGSLPFAFQFLGILLVADLTQYWVHRLFHSVPLLWRFHAVHHSAESMDWLAGSRLHLVDVAVTRGITYIPIYLLGFAEGPLFAYIVFVSIQATFIHSNLRFEFGPLRWLMATPQFHHWHHCADRDLVDKNFAVHLPVLDWLFGTFYLPKGVWPTSYGVIGGATPSKGYFGQLIQPFLPAKRF
jgi:sterol desaturase/sphingolipid hydroxylase (fatty acid hydroxylase superfamily)